MLCTASLSIVAAQDSGERRSEQRIVREHDRDPDRSPDRDRKPDRGRNADRNRDPDRAREVERDNEQRRLRFDFELSDDGNI